MDIIHVRGKIGFIPNQVFPVTALSDTPLPAVLADAAAPLGLGYLPGKQQLDQPPAQSKIRVARRQFDYAMQMLRQHHPGMNGERMMPADNATTWRNTSMCRVSRSLPCLCNRLTVKK